MLSTISERQDTILQLSVTHLVFWIQRQRLVISELDSLSSVSTHLLMAEDGTKCIGSCSINDDHQLVNHSACSITTLSCCFARVLVVVFFFFLSLRI